MSETKKCSKCSETFNVSYFFKDSFNSSGYSSSCKKCKLLVQKELMNKRKDRIISYPDEKSCTRCKETKLISEFSKNKLTKDGLSLYCKLCRRLNDKDKKENTENNIISINEHKQKAINFKINNIDISFNSAQVKEGELLEQLESLNNHNMIGNDECDGFENV